MSRLIAALLTVALCSSAALAADPAKEKADFQRRLESVKTLTAALQRDEQAATPAGKEALATVAARQKEAEELAAVGEYEVAAAILDEGYRKLTATLIKAKAGPAATEPSGMSGSASAPSPEKLKADFARKLLTASALLEAEKRADTEKGNLRQVEIAGHEAEITQAKNSAAAGDYLAANRQIDALLTKEKRFITSNKSADPANAKLKTGSAALGEGGERGASAEDRQAELAKTLRSAGVMRDLVVRRGKERGVDTSATVGRIDQLIEQARQSAASDPGKAQQAGASAYDAARSAVESFSR